MLSGEPQGTILGPLLFLIVISDIDKDVSISKLVSLADDTRLYSGAGRLGTLKCNSFRWRSIRMFN